MSIEIKREYWDDGKLKYEVTYRDNKRHGTEKLWHENGKPQYEATYQNGKHHGITKGWYKNGNPLHETPYQGGRYHGIARWWDENGKLQYKEYYLYDEKVTEEEYRKHELIEELSCLSK